MDPFTEPQFTGDLGWLSNFDTTPFRVPSLGVTVKSMEHWFNAMKFEDLTHRAYVLEAPTPGKAKARGRSRPVPLRSGWNEGVRVRVMQTGLLAKFALPEMASSLKLTGTMALIETNRWHDNFWGDCIGGGRSPCGPRCMEPGTNMLGELLMALRCQVVA